MGKTVAPAVITRLNLINTIQKQYGPRNPFFVYKDGKDMYDFKRDIVKFTCCNNSEHVHHMSPLQMLQLIYIYGPRCPCPMCNKIGLKGNRVNRTELGGQEQGSDMELRKKFIESDDPTENAMKESLLEAESNAHVKEASYHTPKEEEIVESVNYDDYIKENPDFEKETKEIVENMSNEDDDIIEPEYEDDDIVESESYDEYILKNPDYDNKVIGDERFNQKPKNKFDTEYLFSNGAEDCSMYAFNEDEQTGSVQTKGETVHHVKEGHSGAGKIIHTELPKEDTDGPEINQEIISEAIAANENMIDEEPIVESEDIIEESDDDFYADMVDDDNYYEEESEKSNDEDKNILYDESINTNSNESETESDLDDDEEDFEIR